MSHLVGVLGYKRSLRLRVVCHIFSTEILEGLYGSDCHFKVRLRRDPGPDEFLFHFLCKILRNRAIKYSGDRIQLLNHIRRNAKFIQGRCGYNSWVSCLDEVCKFVVVDEGAGILDHLELDNDFSASRYEDSARSRLSMSGWIGDFDYIKTHTSQPDLHMATPGSYSETVSAAAYRNHTKVLEYLLDLDPSKGNMESALSSGVGVAGHLGIAKIVSSRYPELLQDKQCLASILDSAARFGHIKVVQYLLDKHALSKKRGSKLISRALYRACEGGHTAIVEYLLHRIDSEILGWMITSYGLCLRAAARRGNADVMALLLSANDPKLSPSYPILGYLEEIDVINDPLSEAAKFGHVPIVRLLLERAVLTGDSEHEYGVQEALAAAIANEQYAVVELLLSRRHGGQ